MGNVTAFVEHSKEFFETNKTLKHPEMEIEMTGISGFIHNFCSELQKSQEFYRESREKAEETEDERAISLALCNIGIIEAEKDFEQFLEKINLKEEETKQEPEKPPSKPGSVPQSKQVSRPQSKHGSKPQSKAPSKPPSNRPSTVQTPIPIKENNNVNNNTRNTFHQSSITDKYCPPASSNAEISKEKENQKNMEVQRPSTTNPSMGKGYEPFKMTRNNFRKYDKRPKPPELPMSKRNDKWKPRGYGEYEFLLRNPSLIIFLKVILRLIYILKCF